MSTSFEQVHAQQIVGTLTTVNRLIVHGHLQSFWFRGLGLARFLDRQGLHIGRDFGGYVRQASDRVIAHAKSIAATARRPYIFQRRVERDKDDLARQIARRDGITQGLICVLSDPDLRPWPRVAGPPARPPPHRLRALREHLRPDRRPGSGPSPLRPLRPRPVVAHLRCLRAPLQPPPPAHQASRLRLLLLGHRCLRGRHPGSRLYRVTERGHRVVGLAIRFCLLDFPQALAA